MLTSASTAHILARSTKPASRQGYPRTEIQAAPRPVAARGVPTADDRCAVSPSAENAASGSAEPAHKKGL